VWGRNESVVGDIMRLLFGKGADVNLTTTAVSDKKLVQCYHGD
jgi:hypothetical protein